jgi:hypothetical protein
MEAAPAYGDGEKPMALKRNKIYLDFELGSFSASAPCTDLTLGVTPGDRYGALLPDFPPLTAGSPEGVRNNRAVKAQWIPRASEGVTDVSSIQGVCVLFARVSGTPIDDPLTERNFRVVVQRGDNVGTIRGSVVVTRQHSMEV